MNLAEGVQIVSFGLLSLLVIGAALGVVLFQNIVHSAFLLSGVLISIAGLYLLLNADFVAAAQVLIYVGAVNIIILFAVMLVNKQEDFAPLPRRWIRQGASAFVCLGLFTLLSLMVITTNWSSSTSASATTTSTTLLIGEHFFSDFLLPFELASVLLLMALIGAVVLARRELLPEDVVSPDQQPVLTLPERPRQPLAVSSGTSSSPKSTSE